MNTHKVARFLRTSPSILLHENLTNNNRQLLRNQKLYYSAVSSVPLSKINISSKPIISVTDSLFNGLIDTTFLKRPDEILMKSDNYYSDSINTYDVINSHLKPAGIFDPVLINLSHAIISGNSSVAWDEFQKVYTDDLIYLSKIPRVQWSLLLNLITSKAVEDPSSWTKTSLIFESMVKLDQKITSSEYSKVFRVASKARKLDELEKIWNFILSVNAEKSVGIWNSYIKATCNADSGLWFRRFNRGYHQESETQRAEPLAFNNAVDLVTKMIEEGTTPNAQTYELVLLYLGQCGQLDYAQSLIYSVWGISFDHSETNKTYENDDNVRSGGSVLLVGDPNYPTVSTLIAIIDAFGASDSLVTGIRLMEKMQKTYNLEIVHGSQALLLWKAVMRWAFYSSEPWGNTPTFALELVWNTIIERYQIKPSGGMIFFKILREMSRRDYDSAANLIPMLLNSPNVKYPKLYVANALRKVSKGYIRAGQADKCLQLLNEWAPLDPLYQRVLEDVQKRIDRTNPLMRLSSRILSVEELGRTSVELDDLNIITENNDSFDEEELDIDYPNNTKITH